MKDEIPPHGDNWVLWKDEYPTEIPTVQNTEGVVKVPKLTGYRLIVEGRWTSEHDAVMEKYPVTKLMLNGSQDNDFNFLGRYKKRLVFLAVTIPRGADGSSISELSNLKKLSIYGDCSNVDFTKLRKLEELSDSNDKIRGNWTECSWIKYLSIGNIKLPDLKPLAGMKGVQRLGWGHASTKSFDGLEKLTSLKDLTFHSARLETLDGIEKAKSVTGLTIGFMPHLVDISAIGKMPQLRGLMLDHLSRLRDLGPLRHCRELRWLSMPDCIEFNSLEPIGHLKKLRFFAFGDAVRAKITDGNLQPLLDLPELETVLMPEKRFYKPPLSAIEAACAERRRGQT